MVNALGQQVYAQQQGPQATGGNGNGNNYGQGPDGGQGPEGPQGGNDVVEGEFREA